jgi:hypothetical protein
MDETGIQELTDFKDYLSDELSKREAQKPSTQVA